MALFTERKRAILVCVVAITINLICSAVVRCLNLPLWLDTTGTVYAAMVLGFPYGFVVGLVNNAFWTIVTHGHNSFAFYIVSMAAALIAAKVSPTPAKMTGRVFAELLLFLFLVSALLAFATTLFVSNGISSDFWGQWLMYYFEGNGMNPICALMFSIAGIKLLDTAVTLIAVSIVLKLTPLKYLDPASVLRRTPL